MSETKTAEQLSEELAKIEADNLREFIEQVNALSASKGYALIAVPHIDNEGRIGATVRAIKA